VRPMRSSTRSEIAAAEVPANIAALPRGGHVVQEPTQVAGLAISAQAFRHDQLRSERASRAPTPEGEGFDRRLKSTKGLAAVKQA
jgi:hypothetical protein